MTLTRVALSKGSPGKYTKYAAWLEEVAPSIACIDLSVAPDPAEALARSHGLLLTGGADVDPAFFGKSDPGSLCNVDRPRDEQEFAFIEAARAMELPILGICRGMQILNVALGGTLILDLPVVGVSGHGKNAGRDVEHLIAVAPGSRLRAVIGLAQCSVNSAHHQAVDLLAPGLRAAAHEGDGVIEAFEWEMSTRRSYLLGVQWHPERMRDRSVPASRNIAHDFLHAAEMRSGR